MENLKEALKRIFNTAMSIDSSLEDKKITGIEWVKIAASGIAWMWIFKNFQLIAAELTDLNDAKQAELNAWVAENFDLRNDVIEQIVEEAIAMLAMFMSIMIKTRIEKPV